MWKCEISVIRNRYKHEIPSATRDNPSNVKTPIIFVFFIKSILFNKYDDFTNFVFYE